MITVELPSGDLPDEATLEISAKNIIGTTDGFSGDPDPEIPDSWETADGAEASVDITLKNAKPEVDESDVQVEDDEPVKTSESLDDYLVHPTINIDLDNKGDCTAKYWAEIHYKPTDDWSYDYAGTTLISRSDGKISTIGMEVSDGFDGYIDVKIDLEAKEEYGSWQKEIEKDHLFEAKQEDDDGGGGSGGGGCPYVSPYNGTKFKRDNNILIQSEFKDGEVTDYYKLDNDLAEQNGNYSLKIEEFENSEDYLDQMKLHTIDHKEGYNVGVTPDGEYLTYKDSEAPESAQTAGGDDVLNKVDEKNDGKRLEMEAGSEITLDYGDRSFSGWKHNKLVLRSSGFSSYTDESDGFSTNAVKTSLYVKLRSDNSDWYNVTVTHPRNNPHDHVIPLEDTIHEMMKDGHTLDDMEVKIRSTKKHNVDYVGLDDSAPTPVKVEEADLLEVMKTNLNGTKIEKTSSLKYNDSDVVNLIPGEECTVTFEAPDEFPGNAFEERDFIIETNGWYTEYQ